MEWTFAPLPADKGMPERPPAPLDPYGSPPEAVLISPKRKMDLEDLSLACLALGSLQTHTDLRVTPSPAGAPYPSDH